LTRTKKITFKIFVISKNPAINTFKKVKYEKGLSKYEKDSNVKASIIYRNPER